MGNICKLLSLSYVSGDISTASKCCLCSITTQRNMNNSPKPGEQATLSRSNNTAGPFVFKLIFKIFR